MQYALYQGYYVQLDFHGNQYGDQSFYDTKYFVASWKQLLTCVLACIWVYAIALAACNRFPSNNSSASAVEVAKLDIQYVHSEGV